jgi:hypothetical protein
MKLTQYAIETIESIVANQSFSVEDKLRKIAVQIDFCTGETTNGLTNGLTQVICNHFDEGIRKGREIEKVFH